MATSIQTQFIKGQLQQAWEIPWEILRLTFLSSYLDLTCNSLSGALPIEAGGLNNLNKLVLAANQLSGEIPDNIGNCIVLEFLLLDRNSFEGSMPHSLKNVKGLCILNLTIQTIQQYDALRIQS
jgi:hypothetical protein